MSKYMTPVLVLAVAILAVALFIKGGEVITAYQVATTNQTAPYVNISSMAPTVENLKCYDYNDHQISTLSGQSMPSYNFSLKGGTTARVVCNATANDYNGGETINGTTPIGKIYHDTTGEGDNMDCTANSLYCYLNSSCKWLGVKNATAQYVECSYDVWYNARNTTKDNGVWVANITVSDGGLVGQQYGFFWINELLAVGVPSVLNFGSAVPGENISTNKTHAVTNYGNVPIDIYVNGSNPGMDCTSATDIPVGNIYYNCTNATNGAILGIPLGVDPEEGGCEGFNLAPDGTGTFPPQIASKNTYWGVIVPQAVYGNCQGTIWFEAVVSGSII